MKEEEESLEPASNNIGAWWRALREYFTPSQTKRGESIIHPKLNPFWDNRTMYLFIALLKVWGDMIKVALRKNTIIRNEIQLIYLLFLCCHDTRH